MSISKQINILTENERASAFLLPKTYCFYFQNALENRLRRQTSKNLYSIKQLDATVRDELKDILADFFTKYANRIRQFQDQFVDGNVRVHVRHRIRYDKTNPKEILRRYNAQTSFMSG